ncbi:MAG TPA: hypothetical protein VNK52_02365, partial [Hyphomicrobiaceae bacterium]|nr:hypothetical protein [Hyphomicrobiaceae bacterium]
MVEGTGTIRTRAAALSAQPAAVIGGLVLVLAALIIWAALTGAYPISPTEAVAAIGRLLTGRSGEGQIDTVLFEVRLPRVFAA